MLKFAFSVLGCMLLLSGYSTEVQRNLKVLEKQFVMPPDQSRPGVYWYFMDGNVSKEGMTKDLESMKEEGIGSVVFLEVNIGTPRGKVDFLSEEWKSCFRHAVNECERLGITMILGIGPGWTGSGGPWVRADEASCLFVDASIWGGSANHTTGKTGSPNAIFRRGRFYSGIERALVGIL